jgi:hypothetical protein
MDNIIIQEDGKFFHPADCPAPYEWARVSGERVKLQTVEGLWCEITEDQEEFEFQLVGGTGPACVKIVGGFRNKKLLGSTIPLTILLTQDLDILKKEMKQGGMPSCTRLNLLEDFLQWYVGYSYDPTHEDWEYNERHGS